MRAAPKQADDRAPRAVWRFVRDLLEVYWQNEVPLRAAGISYFVFFSFIPILTTLVSLAVMLPFLGIRIDQILPFLTRWLLPDAIHEVQDYLLAFAERANVVSLVSIGVTLWLLVKIAFFFETALDKIWMSEEPRSVRRLLKNAVLGWLALGAIASLGALASGHGFRSVAIEVLGTWLFFLGFNKKLPHRKIALKHSLPGSLIGGTVWYVSKWGFSAYMQRLAKPDQIYAILGVLPLLILWLYFSVYILLFSACLNFAFVRRAQRRM